MKIVNTVQGNVGEGERTAPIAQNPKSLAAASNLMSMTIGVSHPDPLAGKAITGARADMLLASRQLDKSDSGTSTIKQTTRVPDIFARGDRVWHKVKNVFVVVMELNTKPGQHMVIDGKGNRWLANARNLQRK